MNNITTILFDIDGTILDTREFIGKATEHALKLCGYKEIDPQLIAKTNGIPFPDYYYILAGANSILNIKNTQTGAFYFSL